MGIRIYLTGRMAVEKDGSVVADERRFRGRQGRVVFAYLVLEHSRPVSREELARVVWAEDLPPAWEVALSALASKVGSTISTASLKEQGLSIIRGMGRYQMRLPADTWIDLHEGASAVDAAEGAMRAGEHHRVLGPATVAVSISRRSFLSGVSGEWVESQRRRLERQRVRALDCLAEMWLALGEGDLAVENAIEAIAVDPYRESSHRLLMRAYLESGNRASAINAYHQLRISLENELGAEPTEETQSLYRSILG